MEPGGLLERVRVTAGLTQDELARRAGTSRTTLSAYENGRKSPTVATFARLLADAGYELAAEPQVTFTRQPAGRGRGGRVGVDAASPAAPGHGARVRAGAVAAAPELVGAWAGIRPWLACRPRARV